MNSYDNQKNPGKNSHSQHQEPCFEPLDIAINPISTASYLSDTEHEKKQDESQKKYVKEPSFFGISFLIASFLGLGLGAVLAFLLISGTITLSHKEIQGFFAKIQKVDLLLK